jgi:hypothetical protein
MSGHFRVLSAHLLLAAWILYFDMKGRFMAPLLPRPPII